MIAPLAVGAALSLALAACGSETETASSSGAETSASSTPADEQGEDKAGDKADEKAEKKPDQPEVDTSNSVLPSVQVKDVAGGEVDLAALVPSRTPILLWAWAPHCPTCAGEAPAVEAFAKKHADSVTVVGIGTQDDLALAEDFVSTYGVSTPQMLWDPGFESWQALEITGQPTWVLLSPGGEEIDRWQGGLPEGEILDRV
jgi:thiol-disulfide isomerase/thioredoxin